MPEYIIEVSNSPTGNVSGILYFESGTIAGTAEDIDSLEKEFKEFISTNYNIPVNDISFHHR